MEQTMSDSSSLSELDTAMFSPSVIAAVEGRRIADQAESKPSGLAELDTDGSDAATKARPDAGGQVDSSSGLTELDTGMFSPSVIAAVEGRLGLDPPPSNSVSSDVEMADADDQQIVWVDDGLLEDGEIQGRQLPAHSGVSSRGKQVEPQDRKELRQFFRKLTPLTPGVNGRVYKGEGNMISGIQAITPDTVLVVKSSRHTTVKTPNEIMVLRHLGLHENIVRYYGHYFSKKERPIASYSLFQYCDLGDLDSYCNAKWQDARSPPVRFLWRIIEQVSAGLQHCHQRGVIHGDLKPKNILVTSNAEDPNSEFPTLKLADFGSSSVNARSTDEIAQFGTWPFCSPESYEYYRPGMDIWALGVTIHKLAYQKYPVKLPSQGLDGIKKVPLNQRHEIFTEYVRTMEHRVITVWECDPIENGRTRLLSWFVMRMLDHHIHRITAKTLHDFAQVIFNYFRMLRPKDVVYVDIDDVRPGVTDDAILRKLTRNIVFLPENIRTPLLEVEKVMNDFLEELEQENTRRRMETSLILRESEP